MGQYTVCDRVVGMGATRQRAAAAETAFAEAVRIMAQLRAPGGCPWDREQTFESIRPYTVEETYEVLDAIERQDWTGLREELGDLLLQVLFYAQMATEAGHFTIADVISTLNEKLIRRHPHIFGESAGEDISSHRVLTNWERIKTEEKSARATSDLTSLMEEVPRALPAAAEAQKLGSKAAKVHFDWPSVEGLFAKLDEEVSELRVELSGADEQRRAEEAGDLLFTAVQLARHAGVDAEMALRGANAKFRRRFGAMEQEAARSGQTLAELTPSQLEGLWENAKAMKFSEDSSNGNPTRVE
jgi:XTP/dITP diphosphohydrolase/ATP diphosphatase